MRERMLPSFGSLPWLIGFCVGVGLVLTLVLALVARHRRRRTPERLPYRVNDQLLTASEYAFLVALAHYLEGRLVVLAKVSLKDLFVVTATGSEYTPFFNRIRSKHVDFLLCDPVRLTPLCGIELDDPSHLRPERVARDEFVDALYRDAGLPLWHVPTAEAYPDELFEAAIGSLVAE